ncbi:Rv1733c family protein [Spirillospora sp. CA-255316]
MRDSGIGDGGTPRGPGGPRDHRPPRLRRRLRPWLGLERNDLRRPVDRTQRAVALALLLVLLALAPPAAVWCGSLAYGSGLRAEKAERAERQQVVATVVATGGVAATGDRYVHETVQATWPRPGATGQDAKPRTGTLPSWQDAKVGSKKTIWVDRDGDPVVRPRPHSRTVTDAAYAGGAAAIAAGLPLLGAYLLVRHRCDRRRYELWDDAWARLDADRGRHRPF